MTDEYDDDYDQDWACMWCGGDGVTECDDPIQCLDPSCTGELCTCSGCRGSGLAKDQVVW